MLEGSDQYNRKTDQLRRKTFRFLGTKMCTYTNADVACANKDRGNNGDDQHETIKYLAVWITISLEGDSIVKMMVKM